MIRFTLRLSNITHKAVLKRAEKAGVSTNRQIENELAKGDADQYALDWQDFWDARKANPPGVLEHPTIERERVFKEFKKSRP